MDEELFEIILRHSRAYPEMEPVDYVKLLYQNEFGCAHAIRDPFQGMESLWEEFRSLPAHEGETEQEPCMEPIGNGLCRIFLTPGERMKQFLPLLNLMCSATARTHLGSRTRLTQKLEFLRSMAENGLLCATKNEINSFLNTYINSGGGMVRHSHRYKEAYHPHYRVVKASYYAYLPVFQAVMKLLDAHEGDVDKKPVILAVDGRCGSGKTFLAKLLAEVFGCEVFHMDDFFLPVRDRQADWMLQPAGNIDRARFLNEVLIPLKKGENIQYRPYSCQKGETLPLRTVKPGRLAIVEGSYSLHTDFRKFYDYRVFLTCSSNVQQRRIFLRGNGSRLHDFLETWIPLEERYITAMNVIDICDLTIDTSDFTNLT
ncbi:MAG: DNK domain-containing protein [Oscillospiraceae bacterium]